MQDSFKRRALRKRYWLTALLAFTFMAAGLYNFPSQKSEKLASSPSPTSLASEILKLPLFFERNAGQIQDNVKFFTRGRGYSFYFTPQEIVMVLQGTNPGLSASVLKMSFIGANPKPTIEGVEQLKSKSNYIIGNNSKNWRTDVSHFSKVAYQGLYSGIDAIFYGNGEEFEYDLCIAPGISPHNARFFIEGADQLFTDSEGNLHIIANEGRELLMHKPFVYQKVNDELVGISGEYILLAKNEVGFSIGPYDVTKELIIDPILDYSSYMGGAGHSQMTQIVVDRGGNAFVIGHTVGLTTDDSSEFEFDSQKVVISKIDTSKEGNASLVYSTYLGGSGTSGECEGGIALDHEGNIFVSGQTDSADFPVTEGAFKTILEPDSINAFVLKLDPDGANFIYSTFLGGSQIDWSYGLKVDSSGKAYVTGVAISNDFPTTTNALQPSKPENAETTSYLSVLNETGSKLIYSSYLGSKGRSQTYGHHLAIDKQGNGYLTGFTNGLDFPVTPGAYQRKCKGSGNVFVTKINPFAKTGAESLVYSTYLGGSNKDAGNGIAVDDIGNAYVTGYSQSVDFPVTLQAFEPSKPSRSGMSSGFVAKFNDKGTDLIYSTFLGGSENDCANAIVLDEHKNAYVTGYTSSLDFPITDHALQNDLIGDENAFISKINQKGSSLAYSSYLGGNEEDRGSGIAVDNNGIAYVVGHTNSPDFPTTKNGLQKGLTAEGISSGFITKVKIDSQDNLVQLAKTPTVTLLSVAPNPATVGQPVTLLAIVEPAEATGKVRFRNKGKSLGSANLVDGIAKLTTTSLPVGNQRIRAYYRGNKEYSKSKSILVPLVIEPLIFPPRDLTGALFKNKFATQTDRINVITWKTPLKGNHPTVYLVYSDAALTNFLGAVSAHHRLRFAQHDRKKQPYTYYVVSVDQFGNRSAAATVTVRPNQRQNRPVTTQPVRQSSSQCSVSSTSSSG